MLSATSVGMLIPSIEKIIGSVLITAVICLGIVILINVLIIRAICKYLAKKNAEAFKYDYLAQRIAEEVCKRQIIIEKKKNEQQLTSANIDDKELSE